MNSKDFFFISLLLKETLQQIKYSIIYLTIDNTYIFYRNRDMKIVHKVVVKIPHDYTHHY